MHIQSRRDRDELDVTAALPLTQALAGLHDSVLLIDAGPCPGGVDSTVVDLTRTPPRILRSGAVSRAAIEAITGPAET